MSAESVKDNNYVCPMCKQSLTPATNGLYCQEDGVEYPLLSIYIPRKSIQHQ